MLTNHADSALATLLATPTEVDDVPSLAAERHEKLIANLGKATLEWDGSSGVINSTVDETYSEAKDKDKEKHQDRSALDQILISCGLDPDAVEIVGDVKTSFWEQRSKSGDTHLLRSYKFSIRLKLDLSHVEIQELADHVVALGAAQRVETRGENPSWFVFQASDLQIGKVDTGGSKAIIDKYLESVALAVKHFQVMSSFYAIEGVQLSFPGDICEGNMAQNGKNMWRTDLTVMEQARVFRNLLMVTIDAFLDAGAPMMYVDVVNGNHDEVQRFQATKPSDGHATEAAVAVAEALHLNADRYGLVEVRVPHADQAFMTVPVGDSIVTVMHGHQFRKGKVMVWWSEQALGKCPAGESDLIQHGHYHGSEFVTDANRTVVCSPTFEGASDWYKTMHGNAQARRGGLIYLLKAGAVSMLTHV